jgi:hypothetical protein
MPKNHKLDCKCGVCKAIRGEYNGKNSPRWKEKPKCIDCGIEVYSYNAKRCKKCYNIFNSISENNNNFKDGKTLKEYLCIDCGKKLNSVESKRCGSCHAKNKMAKMIHTINCQCIQCKGKRGEYKGVNNPNYREIKSFKSYPLGWNKTFKEQIRYRDEYKCQICGKPEIENGRKLPVHHVDYDKLNIKEDNLISLCNICHLKTNGNRKYWIEFFKRDNVKCC